MFESRLRFERSLIRGTAQPGSEEPGDGLTVQSGSTAELGRSILAGNVRLGVLADGWIGQGTVRTASRCTLIDTLVSGSRYSGATQNRGVFDWEDKGNELSSGPLCTDCGLPMHTQPPTRYSHPE